MRGTKPGAALAALLVALPLAAASCSSTTAVNLSVVLGGDVVAQAARLATLRLHVEGDKVPFDQSISIAGKFGGGRETLQYLPGVSAGTLAFTVTILDA